MPCAVKSAYQHPVQLPRLTRLSGSPLPLDEAKRDTSGFLPKTSSRCRRLIIMLPKASISCLWATRARIAETSREEDTTEIVKLCSSVFLLIAWTFVSLLFIVIFLSLDELPTLGQVLVPPSSYSSSASSGCRARVVLYKRLGPTPWL